MPNGIPWVEAIAITQALIALALVLLTRTIHTTQMRAQRALRVHDWGVACIDALAEADHCLRSDPRSRADPAYRHRTDEILPKLSALTDQGRMFSENTDRGSFGRARLPAYRGLRPKILDPLVAAYRALDEFETTGRAPDQEASERLVEWRRYFVSLLQMEVNPSWLKRATAYREEAGGGAGRHVDANSTAPNDLA